MATSERTSSRRALIALLAAVAAAPVLGLLLAVRGAARIQGLRVGDEVPAGVLRTLDGTAAGSASWRSAPHLVLLFQAGCAACRDEIRLLAEIGEASAVAGRVLLICLDSPAAARAFAREIPTPFPVLTDPAGQFVRRARKLLVPTLYRIEAGRVTAVRAGQVTRAEAERLIASVSGPGRGAHGRVE